MRLVFLAAALLATSPALAQDATFKSWTATCRDDGYCLATTAEPGGNRLEIGRHGSGVYWEIALNTVAAPADDWADFTVAVDGSDEVFQPRGEIGAYGTPTTYYFLGDKAQALMDSMMPGTEVVVTYARPGGESVLNTFPLAGLSAALLWIDEQQGRVGSERVASAAPHGLVPTGVEKEGEIPDIPQAVLDVHAGDPDCGAFSDLANGRDFTAAALDAEHMLYLVPCWSGAYNFGSKAYLQTSGGSIETLYFADYSTELGWQGTPYLVNAYFDPEFKELGSYAKSRGVGDCGVSGTWKWVGYQFQLTEMRAKACSDEIDENAELGEFPVVYSAEPAQPPNG